jgi:hypothetical protein
VARLRSDPIRAAEIAQRALDLGADRTYTKVQALIARAEARLDGQDLNGAVQDLSVALHDGGDTPTVAAACHLHLARAYLRLREPKRARQHLENWDKTRSRVNNAFLSWLDEQVRQERIGVVDTNDFIVRTTEDELDPVDLDRKLRGFLVEWAQSRSDNDDEAAKLLKISKPTFYKWRKKLAAAGGLNPQSR